MKKVYIKSKKGITLIALVVTIIILIILTSITLNIILGENGIINKAKDAKDNTKEASRLEELQFIQAEETIKKSYDYLTKPVGSIDFVQPWLFNYYTEKQIYEYVDNIKYAGFDTIIIQNIVEIYGGDENSEVKIRNLWYNSNLQDISEIEFYKPEVLQILVKAISEKNMKIYIGLATSEDWWKNKFETLEWRIKNSQFINKIIDEVYTQYGDLECFAGIYYPLEMYTNTEQYETLWADILNRTLNHINQIEKNNGKKINLMISPFISVLYEMSSEEVKNQWLNFMEKTEFRDGDIFCMQDGLGTSEFSVNTVRDYIIATREAIKESTKAKVEFWLNVENYISGKAEPALPEKFISQLRISALYAEKLAVFSYSHYYNPQLNNGKSKEYDKTYRDYYTQVTGIQTYRIEVPKNGSVYKDKNENEVPVPKGFKVSNTENIVKEGLVISDEFGNEFVWIPVNEGIKNKGYQYSDNETVCYLRYLGNGVNINTVEDDTLPENVNNDEEQINKYKGFYISRYESTYDYNNGNPRVMIKKGDDYKASENFAWQYADNETYTGYLWNNIHYTNAKSVAENMCKSYNYDKTVTTGLVNGTQWDTMLRWIHSCDPTFTKIDNGTTWGNYSDSVPPATEGNYEKEKLKATGSNDNWKANNIYDIAGNLSEWTSETDGNNQYAIRSNAYLNNGFYGSPSYTLISESYQLKNIGFRVVLYIQ